MNHKTPLFFFFGLIFKKKGKLLKNQIVNFNVIFYFHFGGNFFFGNQLHKKGRFTEESQEIKEAQYKHMQKKVLTYLLFNHAIFYFILFLLFFFNTVFIHVL